MKEDYKKEAKRLRPLAVRLREFYGLKGMNISNEAIKYTTEFIDKLKETRYHPDTLEPVEKPIGFNEFKTSKCLELWNPNVKKLCQEYKNALTLEQVFERYKEMKGELKSLEPSPELQTQTTHVVIDGELVPVENVTVERIK